MLRDLFFSFFNIVSPFSNSSSMAWGEDKGRAERKREMGKIKEQKRVRMVCIQCNKCPNH